MQNTSMCTQTNALESEVWMSGEVFLVFWGVSGCFGAGFQGKPARLRAQRRVLLLEGLQGVRGREGLLEGAELAAQALHLGGFSSGAHECQNHSYERSKMFYVFLCFLTNRLASGLQGVPA